MNMSMIKRLFAIVGKAALCLALIMSIYIGAAGRPVYASVQTGVVAAGNNYSLYLDSNGEVWSWGLNNYSQLGRTGNLLAPAKIDGLSDATRIDAGAYHSMAISDAGDKLWGFGYNGYGQIGDGSTQNKSVPTLVVGLPIGGGVTVSDVSVGSQQYDIDGNGTAGEAADIRALLQFIRPIYSNGTNAVQED